VANRVVLDSDGSQANRIEEMFLADRLSSLTPHIVIERDGERRDLLSFAHRLADGAVRCSTFAAAAEEAFRAAQGGDQTDLIRLTPMSALFGVWDSRGSSRVRLRRVLHSEIEATNVSLLSRKAQYFVPFRGGEGDAEIGTADVPWSGHGGVMVFGKITRRAIINLNTLRSIRAGELTPAARRYIFALALVGLIAQEFYDLRQGCILFRRGLDAHLVTGDGSKQPFNPPSLDEAIKFAQATCQAFYKGDLPSGIYTYQSESAAGGKSK